MNNPLAYHEEELRVARSVGDPRRIMPPDLPPGHTVLDIGCGAGQTLIAAYSDRLSFGIDIDHAALKYGRTLTDKIAFACGCAEALPYSNESFDAVVARVSLPYTDLNRSLPEIYRSLRPGGTLWMTLHEFSIPWNQARSGGFKAWIFFGYVLVNSLLFHFCQKLFALPGKGYESFQTSRSIRRALEKCGFEGISIERKPPQFLVRTRKPAAVTGRS
jgi:SAM-dependent methyltransferase